MKKIILPLTIALSLTAGNAFSKEGRIDLAKEVKKINKEFAAKFMKEINLNNSKINKVIGQHLREDRIMLKKIESAVRVALVGTSLEDNEEVIKAITNGVKLENQRINDRNEMSDKEELKLVMEQARKEKQDAIDELKVKHNLEVQKRADLGKTYLKVIENREELIIKKMNKKIRLINKKNKIEKEKASRLAVAMYIRDYLKDSNIKNKERILNAVNSAVKKVYEEELSVEIHVTGRLKTNSSQRCQIYKNEKYSGIYYTLIAGNRTHIVPDDTNEERPSYIKIINQGSEERLSLRYNEFNEITSYDYLQNYTGSSVRFNCDLHYHTKSTKRSNR